MKRRSFIKLSIFGTLFLAVGRLKAKEKVEEKTSVIEHLKGTESIYPLSLKLLNSDDQLLAEIDLVRSHRNYYAGFGFCIKNGTIHSLEFHRKGVIVLQDLLKNKTCQIQMNIDYISTGDRIEFADLKIKPEI